MDTILSLLLMNRIW